MTRRNPLSAALTAVAVAVGTFVVFLAPAQALTNCAVAQGDRTVDAEEAQLLDLVNEYRVANGRAPLAMNADVTWAATWFARDMATRNYIGSTHIDLSGRNIPTRLTQCDVAFTAWAENMAWGFPSAEEVFGAWKASSTHNVNMLRSEVTLAGVARAFDAASDADWYWVLDLTAPAAAGATATTSPPGTSPTVAPPTTLPSIPPVAPPTTAAPASTAAPTTIAAPNTTVVAPTVAAPTTISSPTASATLPLLTTSVPVHTSVPVTSSPTTLAATAPVADSCAGLAAFRTATNTQITTLEQALARTLSGGDLQGRIAELERIRAVYNAQIGAALVAAGCS